MPLPSDRPELWVCHLPVIDYRDGVELQERVRAARQAEEIPDVLLMLEHPPVYTRGRRTQEGELPMGAAWYATQGIDVVETPRGGRATYHGPGQLVGYAIMRTADIVEHVRAMERAIVSALAEQGIAAHPRVQDGPDFTGVWVGERKIASIGVHASKGVTTHGFAVNVDNDLQPFEWIVPCGIEGCQVTSVTRELRAEQDLEAFTDTVAHHFADVFDRIPAAPDQSALAACVGTFPTPVG
jgi:lipoyl(octanoyl) transferase